jgi:hypothetical protein
VGAAHFSRRKPLVLCYGVLAAQQQHQEGAIVMANEAGSDRDMDFEQMMEQRIRDNFAAPVKDNAEISDDRLKEMSKKLPSWSLEPPYSFLK